MIIHHLVTVIPLLMLAYCDVLTVKVTDLNTKEEKCDYTNNCNIQFGEVIRISFEWTVDDGKWNKPQVSILDPLNVFSSLANGGTMTFNVCPHKGNYQTTLLPCDLVLDPGTYKFGTTVTARQAKKGEKTAKAVITFSMNVGSPRANDKPQFTMNLSRPKK